MARIAKDYGYTLAELRRRYDNDHMKAKVGDEPHFDSRLLDQRDRVAKVLEVRAVGGEPPYLVRFSDETKRLIYPGSDCVLTAQQR